MPVEPCSARGQEVSELAGAPGIGIPREIIRHWVEFQIFYRSPRRAFYGIPREMIRHWVEFQVFYRSTGAFSPGADAANRQARAVEGLR
jgi:hypothetical protein